MVVSISRARKILSLSLSGSRGMGGGEGRTGRGVSGREKIKQIGMQRTTTGGWNEGGVKLGQLGVAAPRGWDQYSLFLSSANYSNCTQGYANLFAFFSSIFPSYIYIYIYICVFLFSTMVRYARLAANPAERKKERKEERRKPLSPRIRRVWGYGIIRLRGKR